jgi:hypothetical protein
LASFEITNLDLENPVLCKLWSQHGGVQGV